MPPLVINMKQTGENIHNIRILKGISVQELADVLGFSSSHTIYRWQKGETLPSIDSLVVLSQVFGVSMNEIVAVDMFPER